METYFAIYNVICPILAYILYWKSGKKNKPVVGAVFLYFAITTLYVATYERLGVLDWLGGFFHLVYGLISVLFVFKLCALSLRFTEVKCAMGAFICALMMFLIFIVNTGVYYEHLPLIFESYRILMTGIEFMLLSVCLYSSRVLHELWRYWLDRIDSRGGGSSDIRCDSIDRRYFSLKQYK